MPSGPELDTFKKAFGLRIPHFWVKWRKAAQTPIGSYENMCLRRTHLKGGANGVWLCQVGALTRKLGSRMRAAKPKDRGGWYLLSKYVCGRVTW